MSSTLDLPATTVDGECLERYGDVANGVSVTSATKPMPRPIGRRAMQWIRRIHLYFGLFLFPWAVLYGFTGFLFNHPQAMSEVPMTSFGRDVWNGTPMEQSADLAEIAREVVRELQAHQPDKGPIQLVASEPVRYGNELAFATLKTADEDIGLAIATIGTGGTIRRAPAKKPDVAFPWAIGHAEPSRNDGSAKHNPSADKLILQNSLADRLKASLPHLIQTQKLPVGETTITSVPDLTFVVEAGGKRWKTNYNALKGTVTGKPLETAVTPLSWRRFMTRLHTAHGYPSASLGAKWCWAILVDVMAFVMIYWGASGLLMWWQIKSTRRLGIVMLVFSAVASTALAMGMSGFFQAV